jgi:predicted nucleotidyltransferase
MDLRTRVAVEAAKLIYYGKAKEYKDAKEQAAKNLNINILPSNFEVAVELDHFAQEVEGPERYQKLIEMRKSAIKVMRLIKEYEPLLIGSVWRGTIKEGSDIDIIVYHDNPKEIEQRINVFYPVSEVKNEVFYKDGEPHSTIHIFFLVDVYYFEIVVRNPVEKFPERCEIFGDIKRGISLHSLEKLIKSDPLRKFIPRRRVK